MKLFYSIKYTRKKQLYYRIKYLLRRKYRFIFAQYYRRKWEKINLNKYDISLQPPLPVMPARKGMIRKKDPVYELEFLNHIRSFSFPFNWHPDDLENNAHLWKFNLHYMEFLEETNDEDFQNIISDWIINNPPYMKDYGLGNWNSYVISLRTVVWMQQYSFRRKVLKKEFEAIINKSLLQQILFLEENLELDIVGNHLIKNIKALLWASKFFTGTAATRWYKKGEQLLEHQLEEQILPDGMHFELSPSYHCQVFVDLLECYTVLEYGSLKQELFKVLLKMMQVIIDFTHPDGNISLFNDGGLNMSYSPGQCLTAAKKILNKTVLPQKIINYSDSGYYGIYNDSIKIIIDAGNTGPDYLPAHSHGDIFSFELSYKGKRFIVDTGVYEYTAGSKRDYSRSTKAHNTVNINGQDQSEFYGSFRVGRRAKVNIEKFIADEEIFTLSAYHNGYRRLEGRPVHYRNIFINKNQLLIEDLITGGKEQRAEARILLHPECKAEISGKDIIIYRGADRIVINSEAYKTIQPALWFPDFGTEIVTRQLIFNYGFAPCSGKIGISFKQVGEYEFVPAAEIFRNY